MPYMKVVIDEMVAKGIRDDYIVLVGGAPLNEEFGTAIGGGRLLPRCSGRGRDGAGTRDGQAIGHDRLVMVASARRGKWQS